jgi:uncharacterized protein
MIARGKSLGIADCRSRKPLTMFSAPFYTSGLMFASLPKSIDVTRAVAEQRTVTGEVALSELKRVTGKLASTDGGLRAELKFFSDSMGLRLCHVRLNGVVRLQCQSSLQDFDWPVTIDSTVQCVANDEAEQSTAYEAYALEDGCLDPIDLVAEELLLALPIVPYSPEVLERMQQEDARPTPVSEPKLSPFAALEALKGKLN